LWVISDVLWVIFDVLWVIVDVLWVIFDVLWVISDVLWVIFDVLWVISDVLWVISDVLWVIFDQMTCGTSILDPCLTAGMTWKGSWHPLLQGDMITDRLFLSYLSLALSRTSLSLLYIDDDDASL